MVNEKVSPYKKGDIDMHQMRRAKPAEFWETHIKKWVTVKEKYILYMDRKEQQKINRVLEGC